MWRVIGWPATATGCARRLIRWSIRMAIDTVQRLRVAASVLSCDGRNCGQENHSKTSGQIALHSCTLINTTKVSSLNGVQCISVPSVDHVSRWHLAYDRLWTVTLRGKLSPGVSTWDNGQRSRFNHLAGWSIWFNIKNIIPIKTILRFIIQQTQRHETLEIIDPPLNVAIDVNGVSNCDTS